MNGYRYYKVLDENYNEVSGCLIPDATDGRKALAMARQMLRKEGINGYLEFNVVTDDGCDNIDHLTEISLFNH